MEVNYNETKMPKFRFDRYQSTVVMPNLNYYVPRNVPQNVSQDNMEDQIIILLSCNASAGAKQAKQTTAIRQSEIIVFFFICFVLSHSEIIGSFLTLYL